MSKKIPCPSKHHGLPHWKCLLRCCDKCLDISIPRQDTNKYATNTCSKIRFHVYQNVSCFTVRGIIPYEEQTICSMCYNYIISVTL